MLHPIITPAVTSVAPAAAPVIVAEVLKQSISLYQNTLSYRKKSMRIDLERERLHTQAQLNAAHINSQLKQAKQHIKSLGKSYEHSLKVIKECRKECLLLITQIDAQTNEILKVICSPETPADMRKDLLDVRKMLASEKQALLEQPQMQADLTKHFAIFADSLSRSPRIITDWDNWQG